ncbi:MAG: SDR family oxidoreductase [Zymomonas mobilis]|uniref:NAD(P)-dependent dehydrogenase (Short-subunit alcohol dehydrogenase family) n=1 Tax=Zymomonas mobilis TaxID=542 RepID=A0A542VZB2_ZYMMB|nr:SDR family oxidoreductase [Zymomonas mobilis]TQL16633.1 NAD(P)-dependent dehydrogenase (short-subunit alcohol dehydrogenase family) [Zymomonas mobilis]
MVKIDLSGKTAIVTGSSEGIGLGIAIRLAEAGAKVIVNGRHQEKLNNAIAEVKKAAPDAEVTGFVCDLGQAEGCDALIKAHPACDILVNNVGIFSPQGGFFDVEDDCWQNFFDVNVMSGVRLSRAYAKGMAKKGWGRVLFISSESGFNIPAEMVHYGFSKAAQIAIARGLAKTLAGTGVTVNSVLPGPTLSDGLKKMLEPEVKKTGCSYEEAAAAFTKKVRSSSIIERAASVEEVANMVLYAASPLASATTGAALRVEGGILNYL